MGVFVQPPFWAQPYGPPGAPHALSILVTPAIAIVSSSIASPTVLTTATAHGLASGDTATIAGHAGSTPSLNGAQTVTVLTATTFTVPVNVTIAGTGGTVTRTTLNEPLPLASAKAYARWNPSDTSLDAILPAMLTAARQKVQQETGIVLITETYDIYFDRLPADRTPIDLPWRPVQSIESLKYYDSATPPILQTLAVSNYELDGSSEAPFPARVGLAISGSWPTDLRPFRPYVIRIIAGWAAAAAIPAGLLVAVGKLFDSYVNGGPLEAYEDAIAPFRIPVVA